MRGRLRRWCEEWNGNGMEWGVHVVGDDGDVSGVWWLSVFFKISSLINAV